MKKISKIISCAFLLGIIAIPNINTNAREITNDTFHSYKCKLHEITNESCAEIHFRSHGNDSNGDVYSMSFPSKHAHYPNGFKDLSTSSYKVGTTGYAQGTYKAYSDAYFAGNSFEWQTKTRTITHVY